MGANPTRDHVYQHPFFDSTRWNEFEQRPGDIVVCTSYKAGTTWTQMICALLVHQTPELPRPLAELSPWLDLRLASMADINANYGSQEHRRVIKTHTPLDGLSYREDASYVFCGRDPRDVFLSMQNHMGNMNIEKIGQAMAAQGLQATPPPPLPDDVNERFHLWMQSGTFDWEEDGLPFWSHFRHAQTYWAFRNLGNIHFLHYADLKADLEGQMRPIADLLDIAVPEDKWPALVKAATFEDMQANADRTAPDANFNLWHSNKNFFNKGENRQWEGVLSAENLQIYKGTFRQRYGAEIVDWLERGSLEVGYPDGR